MTVPILVTGGAGYIGSHACKALAQAGYLPVTYDSLVTGNEWAVKWGPLERGDILDRGRLDAVIHEHKPIAAMHFAAFAYVSESVENPGKYYRNNVAGSLNLLEAMRDHGIGALIFSSTCAIFGTPDSLPIAEDAKKDPINPYGMSKLMVERMIEDFGRAHGLRWSALRYFNAAGADANGEIGESHDPETHLIPLVLDAASGRRDAITIFGTDYPTPDGSCVRDYVHVSDLADAHVLALRAIVDGGNSSAYNLGNGHGFSVRNVIETTERVTGTSVPMIEGPRRHGDPASLVGASDHAKRTLGWAPRLDSLDDIIGSAWAWHQKGPAVSFQSSASIDS